MSISPVGAIVAYAGKNPPKGWLLCDGKPIPSEAAFKALVALVGPKTPDLQGYFLRGLDLTRKTDRDDRGLLSIQEDAVGPHTHTYLKWYHDQAGKSGYENYDLPGNAINENTGGATPSAVETRPKNVAVNYIIKAIDEG